MPVALAGQSAGHYNAAMAQPNILLILTDQHRLSAVGAYGPTPCQTPTLDRLAREGVRFENAYTACPVCSPARATILTGLYPHAHGITGNIGEIGCSIHNIPDRSDLLSRRLEQAGYSLGYSGKWHLGDVASHVFGQPAQPSLPSTIGFGGEDFPGHGGGGFGYPQYRQYLQEHGWEHRVLDWDEPAKRARPSGKLAGPVESTVPYFLAQNTLELVDRFGGRGRPWFMWHNFWGPHAPYYAPAEFVEIYRNIEIPPWPNYDWPSRQTPGPHQAMIHPFAERLTWDDWAAAIRYYYAFTTLIDRQIARILDQLRHGGELNNTVVIFAADHGETLGSHGGMIDKGWHHWEETHRIPLIIRWPDGRDAGRVVREFVCLADLYPTICELAGVDLSGAALHGRSLLGLLDGSDRPWREDVVVEFHGVNSVSHTQRTLRWGHLKYGYNACAADELYDLQCDPHEMHNLAAQPAYADALRRCRVRLDAWMARTADPARTLYRYKVAYQTPELAPELYRHLAT